MTENQEYVNFGIPLRKTTRSCLESQKKREGKGGKRLFKEIMAENVQNMGRDLDIHVRKLLSPPKISTQKDVFQSIL